ncbi:MAG: endonuclease [Acidiferrobacter sp.]
MVGAVLTQNTSWTNVERAMACLRDIVPLEPGAISGLPRDILADALRPVGYFNVKAARLQSFCRWFLAQGGISKLEESETSALRAALLAVHGVGPETADDILLYAFGRRVFVIDAYTRRLLGRLGLVDREAPYEHLRAQIEQALPQDPRLYNEYHALIVEHAKVVCRTKPVCSSCILERRCPSSGSFPVPARTKVKD